MPCPYFFAFFALNSPLAEHAHETIKKLGSFTTEGLKRKATAGRPYRFSSPSFCIVSESNRG
jgi:hypothetical protein